MALRDRVHSLETEYAVAYLGEDGRPPGVGAIVDALMSAAGLSHGVSPGSFLVNGSRLSHDVGHAEWALPECRTGRELADYDKATDHLLLHSVVPRAGQLMARRGYGGRLVVTKNNVDSFGSSYGCHENYQMQHNADLLGEMDFVRYMVQVMIPFLVSRQILVGAGRLVKDAHRGPHQLHYELAQRSGFIQAVVSRSTTHARPIFNLGREGEAFAAGNNRRLHLILGDANLSGWATWIKTGSTGLILRLVEDVFADAVPVLRDPVDAIKKISRDLTGQTGIPLQAGGQMTALDLQWLYYNLADRYLTLFDASGEDEELMEAWGAALEDFERDSMALRDRADWAIKKQMIDAYLSQHGTTLDDLPPDRSLIADVQAFDLRYHELSPEGLYHRVYPADTLVTAEAIAHAAETPPPTTRARIRGEFIRIGRDYKASVTNGGWEGIGVEGERFLLPDPMRCDHPALVAWDRPWERLQHAAETERNKLDLETDSDLGHCYARFGWGQRAIGAYRAALERALDMADITRELAHTLLRQGLYAEAIRCFEQYAISRDAAETASDRIGTGDAYRLHGEPERALAFYEQAAESSESASTAHSRMGIIFLARGETDRAEEAFRTALGTFGSQLTAWTALGVLLTVRGVRDQARPYFERALALPPFGVFDLTVSAARYLRAIAAIGLEHADALTQFDIALADCTARAADGIALAQMLLALLATAPVPPGDAAQALSLVQPIRPAIDPPDPDELPPVAPPVQCWLESALHDPRSAVRCDAAQAAGWRLEADAIERGTWVIPLLAEVAQRDADSQVRRAAIAALGAAAKQLPDITEALIACLRDPVPAVGWDAEASLNQLGRPRAAVEPATVGVIATISASQVAASRADNTFPERDDDRRDDALLDDDLFA